MKEDTFSPSKKKTQKDEMSKEGEHKKLQTKDKKEEELRQNPLVRYTSKENNKICFQNPNKNGMFSKTYCSKGNKENGIEE